jgi:serine/threonine-protein kinase
VTDRIAFVTAARRAEGGPDGGTFDSPATTGRIEPVRAARIAGQIAAGLGAAHRLGIVHRDVKPANLMIVPGSSGEEPVVKIVDFGLAKLPAGRFHIDEQIRVTAAGTVFGTVAYMAPELARGMGAVDHRSDLYALGVILYEMLGGKHPFDGVEPSLLFKQHLKQPPPPFAERAPGAAVPPALEAVVRRLLEKDPAARYQSAEELREALHDAVPGAGIAPEPVPSGAPSAPRSRPSTQADPIEIAPPSDASPPPAPAVHSAAEMRLPAGRSGIRALVLALAVLGGAGAAWRLGVLPGPQAAPGSSSPTRRSWRAPPRRSA